MSKKIWMQQLRNGVDMDAALATMREMGMDDQFIFVGGHSIGGQSCQKWAWEHPDEVTGLILMASVPTQHNLTESSIPMMIISGDLDGMEVITMVWDYFRELESSLDSNAENLFYKPVVVLDDVNHMHFASGEPTPYSGACITGERNPSMSLTSDNKANISTVTYVHRLTHNEAAVGMKTIGELGSKFMSQSAVRELLEPLGATFGEQTDCKTINKAAIDLAWLGANEVVRDRFLKRGRPLVILEDEVLSEAEWYTSNLYFNDTTTDEGLLVRSSSAVVGSGLQAT